MTPAAHRVLAQVRRAGAELYTTRNGLHATRTLPESLCDAIRKHGDALLEYVVGLEVERVETAIDRCIALYGWTRDDCDAARSAAEGDARRAIRWLEWVADGGDVRSLVRDTRAARARAARAPKKETTR